MSVNRVGKGDLMDILQQELKNKGIPVSMTEVSKILDSTIGAIKQLMHEKGKVNIAGFGTFLTIKTSARKARNPQNGESITVAEKYRPKFKAAMKLQKEFQEGGCPSGEVASE